MKMTGAWFPDSGNIKIRNISAPVRHQLSHRLIIARFIHVFVLAPESRPVDENLLGIPVHDLDRYAVPALIEKYLSGASL